MEKLIEKITEQFNILKIDSSFFEVKMNLEIKKGIEYKIFFKKIDDKFIITDNKNALRYMNTIYNLNSTDVKNCINAVVNHYHFKINKGEIFSEVTIENAKKRLLEFIICYGTLVNMFLFFDDPV